MQTINVGLSQRSYDLIDRALAFYAEAHADAPMDDAEFVASKHDHELIEKLRSELAVARSYAFDSGGVTPEVRKAMGMKEVAEAARAGSPADAEQIAMKMAKAARKAVES